MTPDRLDELATYTTEDDTPDDARISLPWRDLRDLVALIPVARAAVAWRALEAIPDHPDQVDALLIAAVDDLSGEPERDEL
jgi:hypothetical protein